MERYSVYLNDVNVGTVELTPARLYFQIKCACSIRKGIYRLYDECEQGAVPIGLCVPQGGMLRLERSVPIKRLGQGCHRFYLVCEDCDKFGRKVKLSADEPFFYLQDLEKARFCLIDGEPSVVFTKQ